MKKNNKASGAPQVTVFENPGPTWTLGLPGERTNRMATKKKNATKKKGSKKRKKNSAAASGSSSRKSTAAKTNPPKKRNGKKHAQRARRNPLDVKGVDFMQLGVAGLVAIGSQAVTSVFFNPQSALGIGMGIALTFGAAYIAPRQFKTGAVIGAGVVPIVNGINRLTGNKIGDTITSTLRGFIPAGLLGNGAPQNTQNNMAGIRRPVRFIRA